MSTADMDVEQRPESKNGSGSEHNEEQPPNCLAQADVKTPWLDINARLQLRSNARDAKPKKEKTENQRDRHHFLAYLDFGLRAPQSRVRRMVKEQPMAMATELEEMATVTVAVMVPTLHQKMEQTESQQPMPPPMVGMT